MRIRNHKPRDCFSWLIIKYYDMIEYYQFAIFGFMHHIDASYRLKSVSTFYLRKIQLSFIFSFNQEESAIILLQFTKGELKTNADTIWRRSGVYEQCSLNISHWSNNKTSYKNNKSSDAILLKELQNAFVQIVFFLFTIVNMVPIYMDYFRSGELKSTSGFSNRMFFKTLNERWPWKYLLINSTYV